ncbi:rhodopsin-like orphan GPCR,putative [Schistosoma mansoni]|uniref:rhodopsin-like orphan GPCR,putative n=1 Tax=Schistosoma mansoni TaxID=6183 RepID=UPI0001A61D99|nr:rhodopsin-like orphan GPCR,putative [Schistosoma mansoni]|eukprot:XP_018647424.1 rhodopsin-like orphan GPCR,putative [Schistosoma mansoni]
MLSEYCPLNHSSHYVANGFIWYFFSWYMITSNIIGIIFSSLCFLVLLKHPRVFASTTRAWFITLTASDFFILLIAANDMYAEVIFTHMYHIILGNIFGRYTCLIRVITIVCLLWTSNLLQTGLSIERLASVISPLKTRIIFTGRVTRFTISLLITFSCLSGIFITIVSSKPSSSNIFIITNDNIANHLHNNNTITNYTIDYEALVSSVIASLVRRQRRKRNRLTRISSIVQKRNRSIGYNRESRASLLLLTMNIITLLTNPLFLLFELFDGEGSEGRTAAKLTGDLCISWTLRQFFNSLIYFGNQNNWILYLAFGARFRIHIVNMLMCRGGRQRKHCPDKPKLTISEIPLDASTHLLNLDYPRNSSQNDTLQLTSSNNMLHCNLDGV